MQFYTERIEIDDGPPNHVRVYFCLEHGFFHISDRKPLMPGM